MGGAEVIVCLLVVVFRLLSCEPVGDDATSTG